MTGKAFIYKKCIDDGFYEIINTKNNNTYPIGNMEILVIGIVDLLNELHEENQSVIKWIDNKIEEIKPYNSELCRATLLELKELLE